MFQGPENKTTKHMKTIYISTVYSFGAIIRTQVPTSDTSKNISKQNPKQILVLVVRMICTRGMHPKDIFNKHYGDCIRSSSTSVKTVIPKIPEAWCRKSFKNRSSHILTSFLSRSGNFQDIWLRFWTPPAHSTSTNRHWSQFRHKTDIHVWHIYLICKLF